MLWRLLDYLDGLYPQILAKPEFRGKKLICRVVLSLIYRINNLLCWYYHTIDKNRMPSPEECDYVVSLTTYPARIGNLWRVIEMLFHQKGIKEKYAVCLYLIEEEFNGIPLPKKIVELQERGLVIKFEKENLRCHNKYFYAFQEFPDKCVITVDDDLQYNHRTVSALVEVHKGFPKCIVFNRGNIIVPQQSFNKFGSWIPYTTPREPRFDVCPAGVGGVLYPAHSYSMRIFDAQTIRETCLSADDMWLNFMCRLQGTKVVCTGLKTTYMVLPDTSQANALYLTNVTEGESGNDKQIKNISEWAKRELECDFYVNLKDNA